MPFLGNAQVTLLKDINVGTGSGITNSTDFSVVVGDTMFFLGTENGTSYNLFRTEGTPQSTVKISNIDAGNTYVGQWARINGKYIFSMYNAATVGRELYVSDGTLAGTSLLKDICPGATSGVYSAADFYYVDGNTMYFIASTNGSNFELWKTDGTTAGTIQLSSGNATSAALGHWTKLPNGKFIFSLYDGGAVYGRELFVTDGTPAGTSLLKDIDPGTFTAFTGSGDFIRLEGNVVYFAATDNDFNYELWKSDGTTAGTIKLSNIGATAPTFGHWNAINGKFIFSAFDNGAVHGRELWVTDGTPAGTGLLREIRNGISSAFDGSGDFVYNDGNIIYFVAIDNLSSYEIWKTDGTTANTVKITSTGATANTVGHWTKMGSKFVFTVTDGNAVHGREMWVTDGTSGGTFQLKDINPGTGSAFDGSGDFRALWGNNLLFTATDNGTTYELWKTDATTSGTIKLSNISATNNSVGQWTPMFGKVIFSMNNSSSGRELYKTDGTVPGTSLLKEINIGAGSGLIASDFSINANNTMFFVATINGTKFELWKSDGTPAGTTAITSLNATSEYLGQWSQINGKHTFSMYDGAVNVGRELYCINTITAVEPTKEPALTANVRPNPTANLLTVSISENTTIEEVKIMNLEGQIMMDVSDALKGNKEGSIDLSSLSPGIYLLKMVSKDGGRIVKKIEKI